MTVQRVHIAVTLGRLRRGEAYVLGWVSVVEVQVVGLAAVPVAGDAVGLVHVGLKTGDGQKAVVLQFGVPAVVTVVGEGDDGVAFFLVLGLDLLLRPSAVGQNGVAVQVGLVKLPALGQKFAVVYDPFSHFCAPKNRGRRGYP